MDIKFEIKGFSFNVRSSCIIKDKLKEKVLLTNMKAIKDHEAFLLPGGRLSLLENSCEAVERELKEERGVSLKCRLVSIEEDISVETKFHMIEFVYYAEIEDFSLIKSLDDGWDKFKIFEIDDLDEVDIRPKTIKELIRKSTYESITHNVNYDWL